VVVVVQGADGQHGILPENGPASMAARPRTLGGQVVQGGCRGMLASASAVNHRCHALRLVRTKPFVHRRTKWRVNHEHIQPVQ